MEKGSKFPPCELKGQKSEKKSEKSVTLIFKYFAEKDLGVFFCIQHMDTLDTKKTSKNIQNFFCEDCYFKCSKLGDWKRHILTDKHKNSKMDTLGYIENTKLHHICACGKQYKYSQGLSKHKKGCNFQEEPSSIPVMDMSYNIILEIVKQNQEFKELLIEQNKENQKLQQQLLEMAKEGKIINNNTNCNNNNFNLQLFLNEKCKDALNIDDFVGQIKLKLSDLDMIGRVGYMEGMSKIFLRNLKELDICKRPIHCSDLKREVLYIKDKDAWEKENSENFKIKRAIKEIECKNIKQIPKWREENPTADDTETKKHMEYQNILLEAMGGATSEDDNKKHEKIIRNIAKEVVIDKSAV
jgi:hypothetical protein